MKMRIMIAGPTASGKTELAIRLADRLGGEIISADSRQCYRHLNIGTAKPHPSDLAKVRHYNISVLDPNESDSAATFHKRSEEYVREIESREKRVIFCGGSTLHLQSLIQPFDEIPGTDPAILEELTARLHRGELSDLYQELLHVDPQTVKRMDGMNPHRIIRALAVWKQTGIPFSQYHRSDSITIPDHLLLFLIHRDRKELHQRIADRTDQMIRNGFLNEVTSLLKMGYQPHLQSLNTVGYKEAIMHLNGDLTLEEMVTNIKTATRRYAKRQITWFRKWHFAIPLDLSKGDLTQAENEIADLVAAKEQKP